MDRAEQQALEKTLLAMADDELILGHRNSEWCGRAPLLEEDIAFANLALDEIGHASIWYALLSELTGEDPLTHPDRLVYFRDATAFRNVRMVELPNGDWAFSMLRQYLFDTYEMVLLRELERSQDPSIAGAAAKIRKEELYHFRHTSAWVRRLGLGTEESHNRLQSACEILWPLAGQLFSPLEGESALVSAGIRPASYTLALTWREQVLPLFDEIGLGVTPPTETDLETAGFGGDRDRHTHHLKVLVVELQSVARLEPGAGW
jgi:ring-1,2-phenylacetyl-CoA epoxidase subunit PaaC